MTQPTHMLDFFFSSWGTYRLNGKWVPNSSEVKNGNCSNPEKLFKYMVAKPSELINKLEYGHYDDLGMDKTEVLPDLANGHWLVISFQPHWQFLWL